MGEIIFNEAFRAIGFLLGAGLIVLVYSLAKNFSKDSDKGLYSSLLTGLAACAILGFINYSNLGNPTCINSETDDRGTICYEYADDGYEPSQEERISVFVYWFILTIIPVGLGMTAGLRERSVSRKE